MVFKRPIFLKIAPDLNFKQIDDVIDIVKRTQIDGIVATNTTIKRQNLNTPFEKINAIGNGGLSGKPINKRSTEIIKYICEKSRNSFPVIGVGGIMSPDDALEKLKAGASLVQLYTGFVYEGPGIAKKINQHILKNLKY
jgi:dihydroorotate dehydrogenase